MVAKQYIHIQEDIIKIHHSCLLALVGIQFIYVHHSRLLRRRIVLLRRRIAPVRRCRDEVVLGHRYSRKHVLGLIDLLVELKLLEAGLYRADRIACVVDCKCGRIAQNFRIFP